VQVENGGRALSPGMTEPHGSRSRTEAVTCPSDSAGFRDDAEPSY
jgi:hypothetical protein